MARGVFNPESLAWRPLGRLGDLILLSLFWLLCSLPVATLGASTAALYDCAAHNLRRGENDLIGRFFGTFRAELRLGTLSTLLWLALFAALLGGLYGLLGAASGTAFFTPLVIAGLLLLFFLLAALVWVFPTLSRFRFSFSALQVTALRLAFGHILRSAALALLTLLALYACVRLFLPLFFLPALAAWGQTFLIEPVFARYT